MLQEIKPELEYLAGKISYDIDMSKFVWFRTGGRAALLFEPKDQADLMNFLKIYPMELDLNIIGFGSNMLVRDGGLSGALLRLGAKDFGQLKLLSNKQIFAQCGTSGKQLSMFACKNNCGGLHFYSGIPGNLGGAIAMNAGANGHQSSEYILNVEAVNRKGELVKFNNEQMGFDYRFCAKAKDYIFLNATLQSYEMPQNLIEQALAEVSQHRNSAQPIREKTGGSTFKNPPGHSAWKLIDQAGCRGLSYGKAKISEQHCNFMINQGGATAFEIEFLGEMVRQRVYETSGVILQWEIKIIGDFLPGQTIDLSLYQKNKQQEALPVGLLT